MRGATHGTVNIIGSDLQYLPEYEMSAKTRNPNDKPCSPKNINVTLQNKLYSMQEKDREDGRDGRSRQKWRQSYSNIQSINQSIY